MENEWDIGWCILRCPQTWLENLPTIDDSLLLKMAIEIVDLSIENGDFP